MAELGEPGAPAPSPSALPVACPDPHIHSLRCINIAFPSDIGDDVAWLLVDRARATRAIAQWLRSLAIERLDSNESASIWLETALKTLPRDVNVWFRAIFGLGPLSLDPRSMDLLALTLGLSQQELMNLPAVQRAAADAQSTGDRAARRQFGQFSGRRPGRKAAPRAQIRRAYREIKTALSEVHDRMGRARSATARRIVLVEFQKTEIGQRCRKARVTVAADHSPRDIAVKLLAKEFKLTPGTILDAIKRK